MAHYRVYLFDRKNNICSGISIESDCDGDALRHAPKLISGDLEAEVCGAELDVSVGFQRVVTCFHAA